MFKKFLKMNAGDFSLYAAITGGLFLLGEVVILCVMAFLKPDTSIFLAGIVLPIVGAFSLFIMSFTNSSVMFDTALRFGRTRRQSLALVAGLLAVEGVFVMGLAALLALAERFLLPGLWAKLAGFEGWKLGLNMPLPEGSGPAGPALLQIEVAKVFQQVAAKPEADAGLDLVGGPRAVDEHQVEGQQAEDAQEHHHNGADDLGAPNGGGVVVLHCASPPA